MRCANCPLRWMLAGLLVLAAGVASAEAQLELQPPPQGRDYRKPNTTFRIYVPPSWPVEVLQRLALELDGVDVTDFIRRKGDYAVFTPPQALGYGTHTLRVVEYAPDGSIIERGLWEVEVRETAAFQRASLRTQTEVTAYARVADNHLAGDPDTTQAQGGMRLQGQVANPDWQADGRASLVYNSQSDQTANDRELDLASFLATARRGPASAKIGEHAVDHNSLVMQDFHRRGVSGGVDTPVFHARLRGFSQRTEPITGFEEGFGVEDPDRRTDGVVLTASPFSRKPQRLVFSGIYLQGEGTRGGTAVGAPTPVTKGSARSIAADSRLLDERLRLRAEYARSDHDFDGDGNLLDAVEDDAYALLASYDGKPTRVAGRPFNWSVSVDRQEIGLLYFSLANPGLPSDVKLDRFSGRMQWGNLAANVSVARQTDNVDDNPRFPTLQTDVTALNLSYSPRPGKEKPTGLARLFARPSYGVSFNRTATAHEDTPTGFVGLTTDQRTRAGTVSLGFAPSQWSWSVQHTVSLFDDYADRQADTRNETTALNADLPLGDRLTLTPSLQWNVLEDRDNDIETHTLNGVLGAKVAVIPNKLDASLNLTVFHDYSSDEVVDNRTMVFDGSLTWNVRRARANRPGINLLLNGLYQDVEDDSIGTGGVSNNQYQVFVGVNVSWPTRH